MGGILNNCESCGTVLEAGESFCSSCGSEVIEKNPVEKPAETGSPTALDSGRTQLIVSNETIDDVPESPPSLASVARVRERKDPWSPCGSQCEDIDVLCNVGRIFIEETTLPFEFRIRPNVDGVTDLCMEVETALGPRVSEEIDEYLVAGEESEAFLSVKPPKGCHGLVPFTLYLGYRKDGEDYWFTARRNQKVYMGDQPAGKVIENLKIELNANIEKGQASDGIQQRLEGLDALGSREKDPAAELKYVDLPPDWQPLILRRCRTQRKIGRVRSLRLPNREPSWRSSGLTIYCSNGFRINVLTGASVQLGKNRTSDIVTRIMNSDGDAGREENAKISRHHCHIENRGADCLLVDMGHDKVAQTSKASAYGTFLDGRRVPQGQSLELPINREFILFLAGNSSGRGGLSLKGHVWTCGAAGGCRAGIHETCKPDEPAFLSLFRTDGIPEAFIVLWKFAPLVTIGNYLMRDVEDLCLFRDRGGFAFSLGAGGSIDWIVPEQNFRNLSFGHYRQFGKWAEK